MIHFTCTHCQTKLSVSDDKAGQSGACPKCSRTMHVPAAAAVAKDHAPPAMVEDGEIPLAEEPPRARVAEPARRLKPSRAAGRPGIRPVHAGQGIEDAEIPMAEAPEEPKKKTPVEPEPPPTAGGLIIKPVGDVMVVSFQSDKILDAVVIETIGQELYALVDERACRKLVLDFGHVNFLSSQMLGVLMALHKKATAIKARVLLCAVHSDLLKVFHIVRLERILPIVADRHTALGVLSLP